MTNLLESDGSALFPKTPGVYGVSSHSGTLTSPSALTPPAVFHVSRARPDLSRLGREPLGVTCHGSLTLLESTLAKVYQNKRL